MRGSRSFRFAGGPIVGWLGHAFCLLCIVLVCANGAMARSSVHSANPQTHVSTSATIVPNQDGRGDDGDAPSSSQDMHSVVDQVEAGAPVLVTRLTYHSIGTPLVAQFHRQLAYAELLRPPSID